MRVYIDPNKAPLRKWQNKPAMMERKLVELQENLAEQGIELKGGTGDCVELDISKMPTKVSRDIRQVLRKTLLDLGAYAADYQPSDVLVACGKRKHDPVSYAVAQALKEGDPTVTRALTTVNITDAEDEADEFYGGLDAAINAVTSRRPTLVGEESPEMRTIREMQERNHIHQAIQDGILDADTLNGSYRAEFDRVKTSEPPELPEMFQTKFEDYRDPFAGGE